MSWRIAQSLVVLRGELKVVYPGRDTASDGSIGDPDHAAKGSGSDHNPWIVDEYGVGVVRALDIDEDLDGNTADTGDDARWLAEYFRGLAKSGDVRFKAGGLIIYEGEYASERTGWEWRPYTGKNFHGKHIHISVSRLPAGYDSTAPWGITSNPLPTPAPPPVPEPKDDFLSALTPDEQQDAYRILKALEQDYLIKGKGVRQVLAETAQRTKDLVSGKRPGR